MMTHTCGKHGCDNEPVWKGIVGNLNVVSCDDHVDGIELPSPIEPIEPGDKEMTEYGYGFAQDGQFIQGPKAGTNIWKLWDDSDDGFLKDIEYTNDPNEALKFPHLEDAIKWLARLAWYRGKKGDSPVDTFSIVSMARQPWHVISP